MVFNLDQRHAHPSPWLRKLLLGTLTVCTGSLHGHLHVNGISHTTWYNFWNALCQYLCVLWTVQNWISQWYRHMLVNYMEALQNEWQATDVDFRLLTNAKIAEPIWCTVIQIRYRFQPSISYRTFWDGGLDDQSYGRTSSKQQLGTYNIVLIFGFHAPEYMWQVELLRGDIIGYYSFVMLLQHGYV